MLTKLATFHAASERGDILVRPFRQGSSITKLAGDMMPEVQDWLTGYRSDKKQIAVLVNALGASEYWGQNSNNDLFPWEPLSHQCNQQCWEFDQVLHPFDNLVSRRIGPYGYRTFLAAHPFVHHQNKDPTRAFGSVALSVLNRRMKRVELVALIDRKLAMQFEAGHVIDALDRGEFPDVSMGTKIPWDQCTICGNRARDKDEYCECILQRAGMILPDGRRVGMINWFMRFFDISFVWIGADKTAKTMAKLASAHGPRLPQSVLDAERVYSWGDVEPTMPKIASLDVDVSSYRGMSPEEEVQLSKIEGASRGSAGRDGIVRTNDGQSYGRFDPDNGPARRVGRTAAEEEARLMRASSSRMTKLYARRPDLLEKQADLKEPPHRDQYPYAGKRTWRGIPILVENAAGTWRSGESPEGKSWATKMEFDYGEVEDSEGADGDPVDVFLGPKEDSEKVFVVHQLHASGPEKGDYDEDKVFLGWTDAGEVKKIYLRHHSDNPAYFGSITEMSFGRFRKLIEDGVAKEKLAAKGFASHGPAESLLLTRTRAANAKKRRRPVRNPALDQVPDDKKSQQWLSPPGEKVAAEKGVVPSVEQLRKTRIIRDYFEEQRCLGKPVEEAKKIAVELAKHDDRWEKVASDKTAEMIKEIMPDGFVGRVAAAFSERESMLPSAVLQAMAEAPLSSALATPSMMGIPLKPQEFQSLVLRLLGKADLANDLCQKNLVFEPSGGCEPLTCPLNQGHFDEHLADLLSPYLDGRSYLSPVLVRRMWSLSLPALRRPQQVSMGGPLLSKLGAAYNHYRHEMAKVAVEGTPSILQRHPKLAMKVAGVDVEELFMKTASMDATMLAPLAAVPLALMYSSSIRSEREAGREPGFLGQLIADHPYVTALGAAALARTVAREQAVRDWVARTVA